MGDPKCVQQALVLNILNESIQVEKLAYKLYMLFYNQFPSDSDFWWQIAHEELNHASLLRSIKEYYLPQGLSSELVKATDDLDALRELNADLSAHIDRFTKTPPSREEAFQFACSVEQNIAEEHYQQFMIKKEPSRLDQLFQQLNTGSLDHLERLKAHFQIDEK